MLDHFFYNLDKLIISGGPDYAVIGVFIFVGVFLPLTFVMALKIPRFKETVIGFITAACVTFFLFTMKDTLLDTLYLKLGLITPWYVDNMPFVLRFPTLWFSLLLSAASLWFLFRVLRDLRNGEPLTTKKIIEKRYEEGEASSQAWIEDLRQKALQAKQDEVKG